MNAVHGVAILIVSIAIAKWYSWNQIKYWYSPEEREKLQSKRNRSGRL